MFGATDNGEIGRRGGALLLLIVFEVGAIALVHRLGSISWLRIPWDAFGPWLELAAVEDVIGALVRTVALVIAYWMAASTAAYTLAKATRIPSLIRATAWATVPSIRRVVDRAIAVTVTAASLSVPVASAGAADIATQPPPPSDPIVYQISNQGVPTPINLPQIDSTAILPPGVAGAGYTPQPAGKVESGSVAATADSEPTAVAGAATVHQVVAGDNLWTIAADHMRATLLDRTIDSAEIAPHWRRIIELNTPNLKSGDPNLIYPGERIVLPAIDVEGAT